MKKQAEKDKITALYERLSHDDERAGESVSIENHNGRCHGISLPRCSCFALCHICRPHPGKPDWYTGSPCRCG